jgi:phenylalanyl-tRNA synthetase alpha chain
MLERLNQIQTRVGERLKAVGTSGELEALRVSILGRSGELTKILRGVKELPAEERARAGQLSNEAKRAVERMLEEKASELADEALRERLRREAIDVTLPGLPAVCGAKHPLNLMLDEIKTIFLSLGFSVEEGPEIEQDYYNFEALNIPPDHPARDMQDSFYIDSTYLLRTHTSPVQVRTMEKTAGRLPLKVIAPGKVYRKDDDATHSPMFHQLEGLWLDREVRFSDLKGTLMTFARQVFGDGVKVRFRPSFFPFTEPSAEMDISCVRCQGAGCRVCKHTGWLEILGSGMVHPKVLAGGGYSPEEVTGFAFGLGIERVTMLRYDISDLRLFYDNDKRFLQQF